MWTGLLFRIYLHSTVQKGTSHLASHHKTPWTQDVLGISLTTGVTLPVFCDAVVTLIVLHVGSLDGKVVSKQNWLSLSFLR